MSKRRPPALPPVVPQANPHAGYLAHQREIDRAIQRVLMSGQYILGREVAAFEQEFSRYLGVHAAVGVGSGTDALHLALRACRIGPGDSVITVSHTAVATVAAIELTGATPVLVDIDPQTFTMDPQRVEDTLRAQHGRRPSAGARPKAIVPVHLYGHPADMRSLTTIARRYRLFLIEDCAQSHGAELQGKKMGTWGHLAAFSFYPTKNLGALGDGGAVVTNHEEFAKTIRLLREYGWRDRDVSEIPGLNSRLDELQAAILRVKLRSLSSGNARRRALARLYGTSLATSEVGLPQVSKDVKHVYHQYVVRSTRRDQLRLFLAAHAIGSRIHYKTPIHLQPAYRGRMVIGQGGLAHTERACREVVSLPMHPQLTDAQVKAVSALIVRWTAHQKTAG